MIMRYSLLSLALFLVLFSCKNLPKGQAEDKQSEASPTANAPAMVDVESRLWALPDPTASHKAYMTTGWWHFNMAMQASDSLVHKQYTHKWLKFREDKTFDILVNNEVVDTGKWTWKDPDNIIYLACKDPYINNSWKVIDKGFVMIWIGNTDLNTTGIQIRVANSRSAPTAE